MRKRELARYLQAAYEVSGRRACRVICLSRTTYHYRSRAHRHEALRIRIRDIALSRPHYGYRHVQVYLRRDGWKVNHKLVYRLYSEEGLSMKRAKPRRPVSSQKRMVRPAPGQPNEVWAMDFVADQLYDGRKLRILTMIDTFSRECLALKVGQSFNGFGCG